MRKIVGHWIVSSLSCCRVTTVTKFATILIPIRTTGKFNKKFLLSAEQKKTILFRDKNNNNKKQL